MFLFSRILMGRGAARAGKVPAPAPAPAAQSAGIELSNAPETLSLFGQHVIDSEVEQLYTTWCITRTLPPAYNPNRPAGDLGVAVALARDVLTSKAAEAWVLAHQRGDGGFERYALAWLIQNCGFAFFGPWESIEARCPDLSSIRRFANHWVAWNESLNLSRSGPIAGTQSEFTGLYAATLVNQVVNGRTHDPRMFDLEHWFNTCGDDLTPTCDHNPVVRRVRQWENSRPQVPVVPQVGRGDEIYRQTQATVPGGSSSLGRIVLRMLADLNIRIPPPGKMRRGRIVSVVCSLLGSCSFLLQHLTITNVVSPSTGALLTESQPYTLLSQLPDWRCHPTASGCAHLQR